MPGPHFRIGTFRFWMLMGGRNFMTQKILQAVFGAGCYWGSEAAYRCVPGVTNTCIGYMGDSRSGQGAPQSDAEAKTLRHVEVVVVDCDPDRITYGDLLDVFWECHDPAGPAYNEDGVLDLERSVIFVADDEQRVAAESALASVIASGRFDDPVNTVVDGVGHFHRAREDQQRYLEKNDEAICSLKPRPADAAE